MADRVRIQYKVPGNPDNPDVWKDMEGSFAAEETLQDVKTAIGNIPSISSSQAVQLFYAANPGATFTVSGPKILNSNPPVISAKTQALIDFYISLGVSANNIIWSVVGEVDGSGGSFSVDDLISVALLDEITLAPIGYLAIDDLTSTATIDSIVIIQAGGIISIDDLQSAVVFDSVTLGQLGYFIIDDPAIVSTADNIALTQNGGILVIADAQSASTSDSITLQQVGTFAIADSASASLADNVVLTQGGGTLAVDDSTSAVLADFITLAQVQTFTIVDSIAATLADNISISLNVPFSDDFSGTLSQWQSVNSITIVSGKAQAPNTTTASAMWAIPGVTFGSTLIIKATIDEGAAPGAGEAHEWLLGFAAATATGRSATYKVNTEAIRIFIDGDTGTMTAQGYHYNTAGTATSCLFASGVTVPTFPALIEQRWVSSTTYQLWINGSQIGSTSTAKTATFGSTIYPAVYMGALPSSTADTKTHVLTMDDVSVTA